MLDVAFFSRISFEVRQAFASACVSACGGRLHHVDTSFALHRLASPRHSHTSGHKKRESTTRRQLSSYEYLIVVYNYSAATTENLMVAFTSRWSFT